MSTRCVFWCLRAVVVLPLLLAASHAAAAEAEGVDYLTQVKPIFRARCFACHGALKQNANLRLDTAQSLRSGGDSGAAVIAGKPAGSLLLQRVTEPDETLRMPPEGAPLSAAQIAVISEWIAQGAAAPATEQPEANPRAHWAFRTLQRPQLPVLPASVSPSVDNPLDAFIRDRLQAAQLTPRSRAARHTLLRRVSLDLIGLPPTRTELRAFLEDDAPGAYERAVDRLLSDPRYGQRWARHWMDIWRYSDWFGRRMVPDVWNSAPQIWRWRDWIVDSLNADKGYDRMVLEMIAADELCPDDPQATLATGYLIRNWYALNPNDWMRNTLEHTGKAFLGLTFNCAHCHDHKYDPISQDDYFRLRAFFEPMGIRQDRVPGEADPGPFQEYEYSVLRKVQRLGAVRVFDKQPDTPTWFYTAGDERNRQADRGSIAPGVPAFLSEWFGEIEPRTLPAVFWYPGMQPGIRQTLRSELHTAVQAAESELNAARTALQEAHAQPQAADAGIEVEAESAAAADSDETPSAVELQVQAADARLRCAQAELASFEARIAADDLKYGHDGSGSQASDASGAALNEAVRTASRLERQAKVFRAEARVLSARRAGAVARGKSETDTSRAKDIEVATLELNAAEAALETARTALGDSGFDQTYSPITRTYPRQSTGRRRALAEWIVHRRNPLTARVAVNHIWTRHFHAPLVATVSDFGRNGARPTHPELLDWLAVELMDSGWSLKHLHRLIVTSAAYQRSSSSGLEAESARERSVDPDNRLLWRMNAGRMEAEVLRDSLLYCAGRLEATFGGQELENDQALTTARRSLYYSCHPEVGGRSEFAALFDAPNPQDCYRRTRSIVPQQALALTNSTLVHQLSGTIAASLWEDVAASAQQSDAIDSDAADADRAFIVSAFETILSRPPSVAEVQACQRFLQKPTAFSSETEASAASGRESLVRVLFNHNDFITIR